MDPITAAIIAALTSGLAEVGKEGVVDAYNALKSMLARKYSARYGLLKTIDDLERNPTSPKLQAKLHEEIKQVQADKDPDLLRPAYYINNRAGGNIVQGERNVAGRDLIQNIQGRPEIVALVAIILVAIFALLIWQAFSLLHNSSVSGSSSSPTQIPTYPPGDTIIDLCQFSRVNRADWAYQVLTTESFKSQVSSSDFTNRWNGLDFNAQCTLSNDKESGDTATGDLTVQRSTGTSHYGVRFKKMLTTDSQGKTAYVWLIDDLQPK